MLVNMCSAARGINMEDAFHGAKLVLTLGADLVVLRRDATPGLEFAGMLDLPGGARQGSETPRACALRETAEETGLSLQDDDISGAMARQDGRGVAWFFRVALPAERRADLRKGLEGQGLYLMAPETFVSSDEAIPHFRQVVARMLGLPSEKKV